MAAEVRAVSPGERIKELIMCPLVKCYPADPPKRRVRKWMHRAKPARPVFPRWGRSQEQMEAR